jgi:SAM-dependent methyltransferase
MGELENDPSYEDTVTPLGVHLLAPPIDGLLLDVGCGDGRVIRTLRREAGVTVGIDVDLDLLKRAPKPTVRVDLPSGLACFVDDAFRAVLVSLVAEHIADLGALFESLARTVAAGGVLVLVANHPTFTAPGSAPIDDGEEVLWRPGDYFSDGFTDEPAGGGTIRFHHRTMAELLTSAAQAGWALERLVEAGPSAPQIDRYPPYADQRHIPRLLGVRWRKPG